MNNLSIFIFCFLATSKLASAQPVQFSIELYDFEEVHENLVNSKEYGYMYNDYSDYTRKDYPELDDSTEGYIGQRKKVINGSGDVWMESFWNNRTYTLIWEDNYSEAGEESYSVEFRNESGIHIFPGCTDINTRYCDLSEIFIKNLNSTFDVFVKSSSFNAEITDYNPYMETFPPTPMFDVSQEGNALTIKSYITQKMYDMYLINSVFTYMIRFRPIGSNLNRFQMGENYIDGKPIKVKTPSDKKYCVSMAFKDILIPESSPFYGIFEWSEEKCPL